MKQFAYVLLFFLAGTSCAQEKFILCGNGGGITGSATVYKITSKGKVFRGQGITEINYSERGKIKRALAEKFIQETIDQLKANPEFNHPGNMYSFISLVEGEQEKKITWGDANFRAPEQTEKVFQEIKSSVSKVRFKPLKKK